MDVSGRPLLRHRSAFPALVIAMCVAWLAVGGGCSSFGADPEPNASETDSGAPAEAASGDNEGGLVDVLSIVDVSGDTAVSRYDCVGDVVVNENFAGGVPSDWAIGGKSAPDSNANVGLPSPSLRAATLEMTGSTLASAYLERHVLSNGRTKVCVQFDVQFEAELNDFALDSFAETFILGDNIWIEAKNGKVVISAKSATAPELNGFAMGQWNHVVVRMTLGTPLLIKANVNGSQETSFSGPIPTPEGSVGLRFGLSVQGPAPATLLHIDNVLMTMQQ